MACAATCCCILLPLHVGDDKQAGVCITLQGSGGRLQQLQEPLCVDAHASGQEVVVVGVLVECLLAMFLQLADDVGLKDDVQGEGDHLQAAAGTLFQGFVALEVDLHDVSNCANSLASRQQQLVGTVRAQVLRMPARSRRPTVSCREAAAGVLTRAEADCRDTAGMGNSCG